METIKTLFWVSRPISWINTAYPFAVAYFLTTGSIDATLVIGTLFFLIPYNLLMYGINDVFDYESDLRNPRKGGIEGALLDPRFHRLTVVSAVVSSFPFILFLTLVGTSESTGWLYLFLFTVIAYSARGLRFKEKPFLDSLTSASHFVGPAVFGLSLAGASFASQTLWLLLGAFTLWGIGSHAFGAVQDVRADREGGIASIATVIGARNTVRFSFVAYLVAAGLIALAGIPNLLWAAVPYLVIVGRHWNITDATCEDANRGWKLFIWLNFFAGAVVTLAWI
ncbi:MAG: prenyltransferase [Rhodoluna sp.]|nr:prenyltransferase [Rhodoluna sp.]MBP7819048.1 prenyltransferase [Rhodoluna sp.]